MKIVCDNCATKYQIADEKVSGKAFKIRCKKCSHVIVVNKGAGEGGGQATTQDPGAAPEAAMPAAESAPVGDAVWHLVIDREQVGPMTPDEVRAKVKSGQVDAETYGWREGFDDWLKLSAIEDFKALFSAGDDQATRRTDSPGQAPTGAGGGAAPGADLFGRMGRDEPIRSASPAAATIVSEGMQAPDLSALGLAAPGGSAPAMGQMPAPAASEPGVPAPSSPGSMDGSSQAMTGVRSENSVLFSLNNLSALAGASTGGGGGSGGGSSKPATADRSGMPSVQSEASGLIDIRAMAAATLGSSGPGGPGPTSRGPDLLSVPDSPPVFTPLAPAVLMPSAEPTGVPKWVFALVGLGVLMLIGMAVTLVLVLREPTAPPVAANTPAKDSAAPVTAAAASPSKEPAGASPAAPSTSASPGTKPPAHSEAPAAAAKPSGGGEKPSEHASKGGKKEVKGGKETKPAEKSPEIAPAPKNDPAPAKPAAKPAAKPKDDLDSLLDSASAGSGGKPVKAEKKDLPEQLSQDTIKSTLKGVNVASCKDSGASGVIQVKLTIKGNGKVSDATPAGGGAGADCVASKVKGAKFPEFSGDPMTLTFPFIVR